MFSYKSFVILQLFLAIVLLVSTLLTTSQGAPQVRTAPAVPKIIRTGATVVRDAVRILAMG